MIFEKDGVDLNHLLDLDPEQFVHGTGRRKSTQQRQYEKLQGALLRMNRSIQADGTLGIMKNDRWYKRIVRRRIKSGRMEIFLVSIGHNLYKYHNKQMHLQKDA